MKPKHKMRLMWHSNALWSPSGYGNVTRMVVPLIKDEGYEIACINFYGQEGGVFMLNDIPQFPKIAASYGDDAMVEHSKRWQADVVITLQDIWTVDPNAFRAMATNKIRWVPYVPIDHDPVPPAVFDRLKLSYRVITMSDFGHKKLQERGMHSTPIYHAVNTDYFRKTNRSLRDKYKIPQDMFLFGMVAANKDNPPRKAFDHVLKALKMFISNHPNDKIGMYMHVMPRVPGGFDVEGYASYLGIKDRLYFPDPYDMLYAIPQEQMPQYFNMFNILLMPSLNEGFGMPAMDAQACEVPVIVHDSTSMPEMVIPGKTGWIVKSIGTQFTPMGANIKIPDFMDIYEKMELAYKADLETMGRDARKYIMGRYALSHVWENSWKPFLAKLENEIYKLHI